MSKSIFIKIIIFITAMFLVVHLVSKKEPQSIEVLEEMPNIEIEILKEGEGNFSKKGDTLVVDYVGTFENGEEFDASREDPFEFVLGNHSVIEGWEQGMLEMQVGEIRRIFIPYTLAYGERGSPPIIPEKANLIFEVELLEIK